MSRLRSVRLRYVVLAVVALVGAAAFVTRDEWLWLLEDGEAQTTNVAAPELQVVDDTERLYRIGEGSAVTYEVEERLGNSTRTAQGTTTVLAGDVVVDTADPSQSRIGTIVVNVEMFESDSNLRDKRLRHDFLESTHHPFATFVTRSVTGLPTEFRDGATHDVTIEGDLTVKEITAPATFTGTVTATPDELTASLTSTVLMSSYEVGPIHVAGLVHSGDEVVLTFELAAARVDVGSEPIGPDQLVSNLDPGPYGTYDFSATVQPILEARCVSCHETGGPGWNTVAFDTAADAADIADDIALVTAARYMPPWPASDLSVPFEHDWSLTDDEIAAIADWASAGGGLDVAPDTPLTSTAEILRPTARDAVITPAAPYVGSVDRPDDYRCQIYEVPDPEGDGEWIRAIAFEPDKIDITHHAIVFRAPATARAAAGALAAEDPQPGWTCFGLSGLAGTTSIAGWAPGQQPRTYPEGIGLPVAPGDFLVTQIHYHYDHETPADASALVLDLAEPAEVEAGIQAIGGATYLTPAEIPCTPEESGPSCDRDVVLDDIADKYGVGARFIPDALIQQCGGTVDDYDDLDGTVAHSSCDLQARNEGTIYSVLGHMHEFGAAYRMTLNPDTPEELVLLDIPTWSFEWQLFYVPVDEIPIDRDDVIRFECWWDRTNAPMPEPRYITWNEGTVDEMCFSTVQVLPPEPS